VKDKCERIRKTINGRTTYCYCLRDDCKRILQPKIEQLEVKHKHYMRWCKLVNWLIRLADLDVKYNYKL
jgi:hypothetical protein